jgi:phosphate transport system protein
MERHFDQELQRLRIKLLEMSGLVEQTVFKAVKILQTRNAALVEEVYADDKKVDALEIAVDDLCVSLLALRQPMAVDLRFIVGAIKINNDLERMGDHAVNIAECARNLAQEPPLPFNRDLFQMAEFSTRMMKESLDAFVSRDAGKAKGVCDQDDRVDGYKNRILNELLGAMTQDSKVISRALSLILIARNLERIADLSTNIAEETIFISEARVIKHHAEEGEIT